MEIQVILGDITEMEVDAIVNAANSSLMGGSGVDGAIHRKGGPEILEACLDIRARIGKLDTGKAVITTAGKLKANHVIHTVGPVWNEGGKEKEGLLRDCYVNAMQLAIKHGIKTIAFPNISTGVYRFPKALAAQIAVDAILEMEKQENMKEVVFVCFEKDNYELYQRILNT
ncbi:O-acetyl-ADP-ribose deacetylase [Aureisphaera galaxeae]|uniref:O-acetyl-ADP-ribose deacetylase n=1 Tax=Aureisphaera galaxeae TaxID=1538023 RepID=UPI00234FE4D8|nr:O-acetyl-ADP-ribose deacetylase [Aureisphaera galaxeae]MDC8004324.1 O-acetyl-ADP-ribose deacetylase [Aureisphaera galaxeae]